MLSLGLRLLGVGRWLGAIARSLPREVWYGLALAALLGGAWWWHRDAVSDAREEGRKAGIAASDAKWQGAFARMQAASDQWRANYEGAATKLSTEIGKRHDQENRLSAALADALRLRGPGRAAAPGCRSGAAPGLSAATGEPGRPAAPGDAPGPGLPAEDRAIVPWPWLVSRAEEHDRLRSRVKAWEEWYPGQKAAHEAAIASLRERLEAEVPKFGN